VKKRLFQKGLGIFGVLLTLLICGAPPVQAQDLNKLATELAARIRAMKHTRVTVVGFVDLDKKPNKLGNFLAQKLQSALAEPDRGLEVVDQTQIPQLFEQVKLLEEGLLDPATRQELGKVTSTQVVIVGTVMVSSLSVKLDVKAIDLQTAKVITGANTSLTRLGILEKLASESMEEDKSASAEDEDEGQAKPASQKSTGKSSRGPVRSRSDQGMLFDLDECSLSGDALTCSVNVTSQGRDRWLAVSFGSRAWNEAGNEYSPSDMTIANSQWSKDNCAAKQVLKNVPTRLSVTFYQFGDNSDVERLRLFWSEDNNCWGENWRPIDFEKVAVAYDDGSSSSRIAGRSGGSRGGAATGTGKGSGGLLRRLGEKALEKIEAVATEVIDQQVNKVTGTDTDEDKKPPQ
jgi:FlgO protein